MIDYDASLGSPIELLVGLGQRAKLLRLARDLSQQELAKRSGVGTATLQRFERTGQIALENALRIAIALRAEGGFTALFSMPRYSSLDEALARPDRPATKRRARKRGSNSAEKVRR